MRLLFTALACLISVSMFGQLSEITPKDIFTDPDYITIKVAGTHETIGISLDFEKTYWSYKNRHNKNVDRYLFVKTNFTYVYGNGFLNEAGFPIIGIGIGGIRQKSDNTFFDYAFGFGAIIDAYKTPNNELEAEYYPIPIISLGIRKVTKNNNTIKYWVGVPDLLYVGYVFTF